MKTSYVLIAQQVSIGLVFTTTACAAAAAESSIETSVRDAWIDGRLETTYLLNPRLSEFDIGTDVDDGVLTLSGTVESDIDRDLAEQIALGMDGVRGVDNRLAIGRAEETSEPATPTQRNFAQWVRDATTTAKVKSKLVANAHTKAINIDVDTRNGIVTLKGMVQSAEESMLAEAIARNTDGVEEVYTDLLVIADAG